MRIVLELLFTIVLAMVARAVLTSVLRGVAQAGGAAFRQTAQEAERRRREQDGRGPERPAGVLHKDPVCGTFVSESTPHQRREGNSTVYFCSTKCRTAYVPAMR